LGFLEDDAFDFVYSSIVFQHMGSALAAGYIGECVRITKRGGLLVFQAPDSFIPSRGTLGQRVQFIRARLALGTRLRGNRPVPDTHGAADVITLQSHPTPEPLVIEVLEAAGADLLDIAVTNSLDEDFNGQLHYAKRPPVEGWVSKQYTALVR
jgi:SAM-dependent methyltransferase